MRAPVRISATVSILAGVLAACSTTTTGTLAQTTEPGPPLTTSRTPTSSRPTATAPPTLPNDPLPAPRKPTVPAPANWSTMTCKDYNNRDEETKLAVVDALMAAQSEAMHNENIVPIFKSLADAMCGALPSATVSDVVTGGIPK